jgi:1-acyl-sn-glycerol-3-phosphate acyltransferase
MTLMNEESNAKSTQDTGTGKRSAVRSAVKLILGVAGHIGYLSTLALMVLISIILLLPLTPFPRLRRRLANTMLRSYLRFFVLYHLPAFQACRIIDSPAVHAPGRKTPAIYETNHRSAIDAILLLGILPPTAVVIKARHTRKIGYACLVHFFDFVAMSPGSVSLLRASLDKCRSLMNNGMSLLVFPEGKRTSSRALMPFADFAFRMAIEQGAPIIPVIVHSDRPFLNPQKGSYFPPETVQFRIRLLPELPLDDLETFFNFLFVDGRTVPT